MTITTVTGVQAPAPTSAPTKKPASPFDTAVNDFLKLARETPTQIMRARILKSMGLDEQKLTQMDPKTRQATEVEIAKKLKASVLQSAGTEAAGASVDLTA